MSDNSFLQLLLLCLGGIGFVLAILIIGFIGLSGLGLIAEFFATKNVITLFKGMICVSIAIGVIIGFGAWMND